MNLVAVVVFGLILICCNVSALNTNAVNNDRNEKLKNILKKFKTILRTGNSSLGIPVLDPFNGDLDIKLNEGIIKLNGLMTNVKVRGLSEYDIINVNYTDSQIIDLNLHLSWPLLVATANYTMKGNISDVFKIYGNGKISMFVQNFAFDTAIVFILDGGVTGYLKIKDIKLKLSLKSLDFRVTGVYDNDGLSAILSAMISDMAPELIKNDKIVHEVILLIRKPLDDFLSTKTYLEIMNILRNIENM